MNNLIPSQDYEIWDPDWDAQAFIAPKQDHQGKYSPETVLEYMYECCLAISDVRSWRKFERRVRVNREIVAEYKRTHACERCGIRSDNIFRFVFFELHLPRRERMCEMIHWARPDDLKRELSTRGMYCRRCIRFITREVTENIPAPPVRRG
jgi:hypothetical protein